MKTPLARRSIWFIGSSIVLLVLVYAVGCLGMGPQESGSDFFFGKIPNGGSAFLRVDWKKTNVTGSVILPGGISYCSLSEGCDLSRRISILATEGRGDTPSTNGTISGEIGGNPPTFRGTWTRTNGHPVSIELQQVARGMSVRAHSGLKIGRFGGTHDFDAGFPQFTSTLPLYQELNRKFREEAKAESADFIKGGLKDAVDGIKSPAASNNYEGLTDFELMYASEQIVSLCKTHWEYTGGAHGNSGTVGINLMSSEGKVCEIKLEDLFQPNSDWETQLSKLCLADLKNQQASFVVSGSITNFTAANLGSFNLHPCGLIFNFDPYAVASYAEGSFTVLVPWNSLRTCLRSNSVITEALTMDKSSAAKP